MTSSAVSGSATARTCPCGGGPRRTPHRAALLPCRAGAEWRGSPARRNGLVASSWPIVRRQRRRALRVVRRDLGRARLQRFVLRLDGEREAAIGACIFVAAIDVRLRRQRRELRQRRPHGRGVALQQLAAADREQRVADEHRRVLGEVIADMPARMARRLDHAGPSRRRPPPCRLPSPPRRDRGSIPPRAPAR